MNSRSFGALRARLLALPDAIAGPPGEIDPGVVARGKALARAIGTPPAAPPELHHPEFLARVHDRAARAAARALGPAVLRRAFAPARAPREVHWVPAFERPEVAAWIRAGLPVASPRVATVEPQAPQHTRRLVVTRLVVAAAAIFVSAGAFVLSRGTSEPPEPVFEIAATPLSDDHPSDFLRGLVDRQVR